MSLSTLLPAVLAAVTAGLLLWLVVLLAWWLDRFEPGFLAPVAETFAWGALVAVPATFLLAPAAARWLPPALPAAALVAAAAEGVGLVLVTALHRRLDSPADGLVFGAAVGFGFGLGTAAVIMAAGPGGAAWWVWTMTTLVGHGLAGAVLGVLVALGALSRRPAARVGWPVLGVAGATGAVRAGVLASRAGAAAGVAAVAAGWIALVAVLYAGEHRVLERELGEEAAFGVVPGWVPEILPFYRRRVRAAWWPFRNERTALARKLSRLAFRKRAVRHAGKGRELAGLEIVRLRNDLKRVFPPEGAA